MWSLQGVTDEAALPDHFQPQFHDAISASELLGVEEQRRSDVGVGGAERVVDRADNGAGFEYGGLRQREVAMVEDVLGGGAELQREALCIKLG